MELNMWWHYSVSCISSACSHLELQNEVIRDLLEQRAGRLFLTEKHQLKVEVPLQQQALGNQADPHHTPQRACGLVLVLTAKKKSVKKEIIKQGLASLDFNEELRCHWRTFLYPHRCHPSLTWKFPSPACPASPRQPWGLVLCGTPCSERSPAPPGSGRWRSASPWRDGRHSWRRAWSDDALVEAVCKKDVTISTNYQWGAHKLILCSI